jgi:hypothetical protein
VKLHLISGAWVVALLYCSTSLRADEPILDFSPWREYRATVIHPALTIKPADLAKARQNIGRYEWARKYAAEVRKSAAANLGRLTPQFIEQMIPQTTPLSIEFTPCPACRAQGRTWHPHGRWTWSVDRPDELKCQICGAVFPNDTYPETIELHTHWGRPQTFSYFGGEPFKVFSYASGRPSFSGNIRARKVAWMAGACRQLAEAYALGGDQNFAVGCRAILLRLAEVYPFWLVHVGYGEYADMDPRIAARDIKTLPADELVYPPNRPDRMLHTGYWQAGRASGNGQEHTFVRAVAEAYDLTCEAKDASGQAIYSDADRKTIEEKLLLQSTILLTADKPINNKSVGNRTAAAMVGLVVGHPQLVRFGLDGFTKAVDEWFLPDGGTPESPSYAMMALHGISDMPWAMRGYGDPAGYRDATGKRLDHIDLFHGAYERAWNAIVDGLQGDLTFVPYADTYAGRRIDSAWVELLAAAYPQRPQYLALLKELCGADLSDANASVALYRREPELEKRSCPPFALPDVCLPDLRIGQMRTGDNGRESLLVLSASRWGNHHHLDSLNLYYWKQGHELLGDLGYLWDNPMKQMTTRTLAHNTVIIDEQDQRTTDRGGEVRFFKISLHVKAMRASSNAYGQAKQYQRTSAIIDHGDGRNYVVDFFSVEGGRTHDYVFHGPTPDFKCSHQSLPPSPASLYDLTNIRGITASAPISLVWKLDEKTEFMATSLDAQQTIYLGDGWGQRDPFNADLGRTLPYIIRRQTGDGPHRFVSLFESHPPGRALIKTATQALLDGAVLVTVETARGRDYIVCSDQPVKRTLQTADGDLETRGRFFVSSMSAGKTQWTFSDEQ